MQPAAPPVPRTVVLADLLAGGRFRDIVLAAGYTVAIAVSAQIALPLAFTPVPVTAQTFVVLLGAAVLGARRAAVGSAAYAMLGAAGVPWFAVSGGATWGYLVGFIAAAVLVGSAAERGWLHSWPVATAVLAVASLLILTLGTAGLSLVLTVGASEAIALGFAPFVLGDLVKVALASALIPIASRKLLP